MTYRCQHCGATFGATGARPRCPACMRITTVVAVKDAPPPPAPPPGIPPASPHGAPHPEQGSEPWPAPTARRPPRHSLEGLGAPPWPLWVGVAILAATLCAVYGTAFDTMSEGERLGAAGTFAALGGAGLALAVRGLLKWRPWR